SKKINGTIRHFGRWGRVRGGKMERVEGDGWKEALEAYQVQGNDYRLGRTPRALTPGGLTLADLCNRFVTAKKRRQEAGEIGGRTFADYKEVTDLLVGSFGGSRAVEDLAAGDFEALRARMAKTLGPVRLGNEIQRVRTIFKFAYEAGLTDKPVR